MPGKPKPIEQHRRAGTFRPGRHARGDLAPVAPVASIPAQVTALQVFDQVLADGVSWLARTDAVALTLLRSMLIERDPLAEQAQAGDLPSRRQLRELDKQIMTLLGSLGFDSAARSRLGLAEVRTVSKLDALRKRAATKAVP